MGGVRGGGGGGCWWLEERRRCFSVPRADSPRAAEPRKDQRAFRFERSLDRVVRIDRDRMVPPEPAHHLRQHRTAHVVAVNADPQT